jgi:hypothetical protein
MRTNTIYNPSFKDGITGWSATVAASIARNTSEGFFGSSCLQVTKGVESNSGAYTSSNISPVSVGLTYAVSAYVKVPEGYENADLKLYVAWYNSTNNAGATQVGSNEFSLVSIIYSGDSWTRLGDFFTAPAGANGMRVGVVQNSTGSNGEIFLIDAVLVENSSFINQYQVERTQSEENKIVDKALSPVPTPFITGIELNADIQINGLILNTIDENNVVWICTDISGWWGQPDPEIQDIPRGLGDGSYDVRGRYTARQLELTGVFLPPDKSYVDASRDKLVRAIDMVKTNGWLIVDEEPTKASRVRLSGRPDITTVNARGRTEFSLGLRAADPIKYEWIQENPEGYDIYELELENGTSTIQVNNIGNTNVTALFQLIGPLGAQTTISNDTTDQYMSTLVSIGGPNHVVGNIVQHARTSNIAAITASTTHELTVGDLVSISNTTNVSFNANSVAISSVDYVDGYTIIYYPNSGANVATAAATGNVTHSEADILEIDTYDREIAFNGFVSGQRSKMETLLDWVTLRPGVNQISVETSGTGATSKLIVYFRSGWIG